LAPLRWLSAALLLCSVVPAAAQTNLRTDFRQRTRDAVTEVLAAPEFRRPASEPGSSLRPLGEKLHDFFQWLGTSCFGLPSWAAYLIMVCLVLALLAILAHLVYVVVTQFGGGRGSRRARAVPRPDPLYGARELNYDEVVGVAQRCLGAGDWLGAVRFLYMAAILWLDRAGRIRFRESKTNFDYVRELTPHPAVQGRFRSLTTAFESAIYGGREAKEGDCRGMAAILEALQGEADSGNQT